MIDHYAAFPLYTREQALALKTESIDPVTLIDLLAQTTASEDTKVLGQETYARLLKTAAYRKRIENAAAMIDALGIGTPARIDLNILPPLSFFLRADFALETPYLSRDDRVFSVTENPVRKDWVFGVPLIAGTTWKGALRNACLLEARGAVNRLFGPEPPRDATDEEARASLHEGRICTFTSFFSQIAMEIVNPHDRVRRIGKNPIRIECVPKGARSRLALLYLAVPRDNDSRSLSPAEFRKQVADDLIALARSVCGAIRDYGVSAKKSSGYGAVADALVGERGIIEVGRLEGGPARFAKFSELVGEAQKLAARIQESA
ncbi:MAG TPA: RAMP superfamily CRISPR-associated protein [Bryobacteraceae bacterium]|nr:RAMP superfamily CRISPR-associated protein [Bryobacteraceae bacterium]